MSASGSCWQAIPPWPKVAAGPGIRRARHVDDARATGAIPIPVTSITRRNLTPAGKVEADSAKLPNGRLDTTHLSSLGQREWFAMPVVWVQMGDVRPKRPHLPDAGPLGRGSCFNDAG
jgi:hypothetical protein